MIGFGRKKLCDFSFYYNEEMFSGDRLTENEDEIITSPDNFNYGWNRNLKIEGEIYEERDLGLTKEIIPLLNFLVNYVRSIRTLSIGVADTLANVYSIQFTKENYNIIPIFGLNLIDHIQTILFYSVRHKKNQNKIFLTQKYNPVPDFEKIERKRNIYRNDELLRNTDFHFESEIPHFLLLLYGELVKEIDTNEREKFESLIEFINTIYKKIRLLTKSRNFDKSNPDPMVKKELRYFEVNVFNIWRELESRKYSADEILYEMKNKNI